MIVDILASDVTVGGAADFVANGAVLDLPVTAAPANGLVMSTALLDNQFALGDNFSLQRLWATINWGFGPGGPAVFGPHNIGLAYWDGVNPITAIPPFQTTAHTIAIPTMCDPLDFSPGLLCTMPITGLKRRIVLSGIDLRISQVNLPTALQGQTIKVQYFIQVAHTLPLV
jgi:hypothetical protein